MVVSSKPILSLISKLHFEVAVDCRNTLNQCCRNVIDRIELTMQMITIHALSRMKKDNFEEKSYQTLIRFLLSCNEWQSKYWRNICLEKKKEKIKKYREVIPYIARFDQN